jgi:hypothetical protein
MKITIELEVGEMTGAIASMLDVAIRDFKDNIGIIPLQHLDNAIKSIRYAEAVRDEIDDKVKALASQPTVTKDFHDENNE